MHFSLAYCWHWVVRLWQMIHPRSQPRMQKKKKRNPLSRICLLNRSQKMRYLRPSFLRRMSRKTRKLNQRLVTISPLKKLLINRLKNQQVKRMTNTEQIKRMSLNSTVAMINPRPSLLRLSVARWHVLLQRHPQLIQ